MKILVIGSGGREHALAWRLAQNEKVSRVYVAPGNAGTATEDGLVNVAITDIAELIAFAQTNSIHLTVVGPEAPLAAGIVDTFQVAGLRIFGPTKRAAQLESSKDFAKQFMVRHGIPTSRYQTFTDLSLARAYIEAEGAPIVIKADGLAAGKGVVVALTVAEALQAVEMMLKNAPSGARVVIEECMVGEEASFICLCDGLTALPFASSQDHKRIFDNDEGPNTGGMGAYSPAPVVTPEVHAKAMREVIMPTLRGMAVEGAPFTGFLYAGLMIDADGAPRVVEFNARLGDPETQPILMRLKTDLLGLLDHAVTGTLAEATVDWDRRAALGVVLAAANYPENPRKGEVITGLVTGKSSAPDATTKVFHAGTVEQNGQIVSNGGRVLCVTALGDTVKQAAKAAYEGVTAIKFDGMQYRTDIGYRAFLKRD